MASQFCGWYHDFDQNQDGFGAAMVAHVLGKFS